MKRLLAVGGFLLLAVLAGCTASGLDPQDAINESEAVQDAELSVEDGEFDENLYLIVTLEETVEKNREVCTTYMVGGVPQTRCSDNWHEAELTGVSVSEVGEDGETLLNTYEVTEGGTSIEAQIPMRNGTYALDIKSADAPPTHFQVTVEYVNGEYQIVTAGYNDTY